MSKHDYSWITVTEKNSVEYIPKPDVSTLDTFQDRSCVLPDSYRAFVASFGAGEFANFFRIRAPMPSGTDAKTLKIADVSLLNEETHRSPWHSATLTERELLDRVVFFCTDMGGLVFGWDSGSPDKSTPSEFPIYRVQTGPTLIAPSFYEFLKQYCLEDAWKDEAEPDFPSATFHRFKRR